MCDALADTPAFSRNGETLAAKCESELKTWLTDEAHDDFVAVASLHRKTKSEYLRALVMAHLYGELELARQKVTGVSSRSEGTEKGA